MIVKCIIFRSLKYHLFPDISERRNTAALIAYHANDARLTRFKLIVVDSTRVGELPYNKRKEYTCKFGALYQERSSSPIP